jgi:hypothetical protein
MKNFLKNHLFSISIFDIMSVSQDFNTAKYSQAVKNLSYSFEKSRVNFSQDFKVMSLHSFDVMFVESFFM